MSVARRARERALAAVPRIERRADHWLVIGGPVPPGSAGITLGRIVVVRRDGAHRVRLLRHESIHVEQYRRHGFMGFVLRYVGSYLRWRMAGYPHAGAYRRIPLEIEAYWRERTG